MQPARWAAVREDSRPRIVDDVDDQRGAARHSLCDAIGRSGHDRRNDKVGVWNLA